MRKCEDFWVTPVFAGLVLLIALVFCIVVFVLFVFILCLVCPVLPVSLDCSFSISPSVFSDVYFLKHLKEITYVREYSYFVSDMLTDVLVSLKL